MERDARGALFASNQEAIRRAARRLASTADDADDIVQDVAVVVFAHDSGPPDAECFVGWCCGVARHLAMHRMRTAARASSFWERLQGLPIAATAGDPEGTLAARRRLEAWLDGLDGDARLLLWNRFVLEETSVEVATRLNVSAESVRMKLTRLLAAGRAFEIDRSPSDEPNEVA